MADTPGRGSRSDRDLDREAMRLTEAQRVTLAAMVWSRKRYEMTDSEVTERVQRLDRSHPARGSVVDRLNALTKKGYVEITDDGPPRRRRATTLGLEVYRRA